MPQNAKTLSQRTPPPDFIPDVGGGDFIPDVPAPTDPNAMFSGATGLSRDERGWTGRLSDRVSQWWNDPKGSKSPKEFAGGLANEAMMLAPAAAPERAVTAGGKIALNLVGRTASGLAGAGAGGWAGREAGLTGTPLTAARVVGGAAGFLAPSLMRDKPVEEPPMTPRSEWPTAPQHLAARTAAREAAKAEAVAGKAVPLSESPTAPQHAAVRSAQADVARRNARQFVPTSESPEAPTMTERTGSPQGASTPFERAGRRLVIQPGERTDPFARESAGSAAQATEEDLRRLAAAGDRSAALELSRRRLPLEGRIDYSKAPLPRGNQ